MRDARKYFLLKPMSTYDLPDGLAKHLIQPGDPGRNPLGIQGTPAKRLRAREIRADLQAEGRKQCEVPGFEHLTQYEFGIRTLYLLFMQGERWATHEVLTRLFGRVGLDITLGPPPDEALMELTDDELLLRVEALRTGLSAQLREREQKAVDAVCVENEPAPEG
jgi:hypothetical protein